jgi:hypothetical protein
MGQVLGGPQAAVAAGTATTIELGVVPTDTEEYGFGGATVTAPSTVAAQGGTNFATITFRQLRGGTLVQSLGAINVGTTALTAETPIAATGGPSGQDPATFQAGDVIEVKVTHTGTGGALPLGWEPQVELV